MTVHTNTFQELPEFTDLARLCEESAQTSENPPTRTKFPPLEQKTSRAAAPVIHVPAIDTLQRSPERLDLAHLCSDESGQTSERPPTRTKFPSLEQKTSRAVAPVIHAPASGNLQRSPERLDLARLYFDESGSTSERLRAQTRFPSITH